MGPDGMMSEVVLFRVEDRILDDQGQGVELGKKRPQGAQPEKLLQSPGGPGRAKQDLKKLFGHALDAETFQGNRPGDRIDVRIALPVAQTSFGRKPGLAASLMGALAAPQPL